MIEKDEKLLENRIKLLKNEELKLLKKIDQTRKQADKIMAIKQQNEENHRLKVLRQMDQESSIERIKEEKQREKEEAKQRFLDLTRTINDKKRNSYLNEKQKRIQDEQERKKFIEFQIEMN